jgi:hypothetical protein
MLHEILQGIVMIQMKVVGKPWNAALDILGTLQNKAS